MNKEQEEEEERSVCFPVTLIRTVGKLSVVKRISQITSPGEDEALSGRAWLPARAEEAAESGQEPGSRRAGTHKCTTFCFGSLFYFFVVIFFFFWKRSPRVESADPPAASHPFFPPLPRFLVLPHQPTPHPPR